MKYLATAKRTIRNRRFGSPISGLCQLGNIQPGGLLMAAVAVQSVADLRHAQWFSYAGCAVAHQSPIRIKAWRVEPATRYRCPWPRAPAPENPLFLAASIPIDRVVRSHNFMAPLRTAQPHVARGAGATSLQTVGMAVARNQKDGSANPKAALPPPSPDRQALFRRRRAHHRTARHRA
jgi:hypothetical protein